MFRENPNVKLLYSVFRLSVARSTAAGDGKRW